MRLALTMALVLALAGPAVAQSDDFNPYQAVVDRTPFADAEPLIEAAYGPITDSYSGIGKPYDGGPIRIALVTDNPGFFLFCDDKLAAMSAEVTAGVASSILGPLTVPPLTLSVFVHESGVWFESSDRTISVDYRGVGTKASHITAAYPAKVALNLDYAGRCEEVAD